MDNTLSLRDLELKDESPKKTVENIKSILLSVGIETEEHWLDSRVPYCHGVRVSVLGTTFSTNGKGLTRELALASGYGELMERLQLGYIGSQNVQKDGSYSVNDGHTEKLDIQALLQNTPEMYTRLAKRLHAYTGIELSAEEMLAQFADSHGNLEVAPFFNLVTGEKVYFPNEIRRSVYSANGAAAGNTTEEALVQAISEIVERYHHMQIVENDITLPDIPDNVLRQYTVAYSIITFLRNKGYRVSVKDASLGTKFPCICVCYINESTGKYHTHFGAAPILEIALERALTETFQGRNIDGFASFENFVFKKDGRLDVTSVTNELTKGTWEKTPSFFVGGKEYPYNSNVGFAGRNNKEILKECIKMFREMGYDVLVRDCSCLGFPTYQIIIPGYSEVYLYRLSKKLDDTRYSAYAVKALRNPSCAALDDMLGLVKHINQRKKLSSNISLAHSLLAGAKLSAQLEPREDSRLMAGTLAYIWYALGKTQDVLKCIDGMLPARDTRSTEYLICLKRYLTLKGEQYADDQIRKLLELFHQSQTVQKLYDCIANKDNPFEPFTLHCDMNCSESCQIYGACRQKRAEELTRLINEKTELLDFGIHAKKLSDLT